jgi:hypothetical protein
LRARHAARLDPSAAPVTMLAHRRTSDRSRR